MGRLAGSFVLLTIVVIGGACAGAPSDAASTDVPRVSGPVDTPTPEATPSPAATPPAATAGPERDVTVEVHRHLTRPVEASQRDPLTKYRVLLGPCADRSPTHGHQGHMVVWRPDGDEIVFSSGTDIYAIGPTGQRLRVVAADPAVSRSLITGFTVAPDGEHLVYATCQFPAPPTAYTRSINAEPTFEFELALRPMARGGWTPQRLTTNWELDHFPTWSPDGTRIAFLRGRPGSSPGSPRSPTALMVMAADGTDERVAPHSPGLLIHHPPAWSPDGTRLAVARHSTSNGTGLWVVDVDGETATHLTPAVSGAAWSPDGKRMAFAKADGDEVGLYTIAADGTDARRLTTIDGWWPQAWPKRWGEPDASQAWIETVAWASDGIRILVRANTDSGVVVIDADGQARVDIAVPMMIAGEAQAIAGFRAAAWAPDGTRIALLGVDNADQPMLVTTAPDGSDPQLLTRASLAWGVPQATGGGAPVGLVGAAACRAGIVVPDPARRPGLVADCEALLALRDAMTDDTVLDWREDLDRPLPSWQGVILGGTPPPGDRCVSQRPGRAWLYPDGGSSARRTGVPLPRLQRPDRADPRGARPVAQAAVPRASLKLADGPNPR